MNKLKLVITATLITFIFGCQKETKSSSDNFIKNAPISIAAKNGITIFANDVYSKKSSFKRELSFLAPSSKTPFEKYELTFVSSENVNIYEQLKKDPKSVSGLFTIEINGQVILKKQFINGVGLKTEKNSYDNLIGGEIGRIACNVKNIHDCVSWEIEDMNWLEYLVCAASAPGCYATLWASCTWEVCHNGNPH